MWLYACLFGLMDLFCISFGSWSERPCVLQLLIKMLIRLCLMWEGLVLLYQNFHQGWRVVQRGDERPFSLMVLGSDTQLGIKPGLHWWGANTKHSLTRQTGLLAAVFSFSCPCFITPIWSISKWNNGQPRKTNKLNDLVSTKPPLTSSVTVLDIVGMMCI